MERLDSAIYRRILPILKPLEVSANGLVYERGSRSYNLCKK